MSDEGDRALADLVARARGDGPAPERLAAVRARLESSLGPLDTPPSPPASAMPAKAWLGFAAAAVIAIGVWLGMRPRPTEVVLEAPPPASPTAPVVGAVDPVHDAVVVEAPVEPTPVAEIPSEEVPPPRPTVERRRAPAASVEPAPAVVEAAPIEDPGSMLREEIALLDRAIRARDGGDRARAIAVLEEHRARFPSGRLQPERDRMLGELTTASEGERATP